ncbi:MAG TPA: hypothetical protein VMV29_02115 [Ktedonobacterales bacterium]|nr:hypothetical protein [Ktedonobacterales bacterium]
MAQRDVSRPAGVGEPTDGAEPQGVFGVDQRHIRCRPPAPLPLIISLITWFVLSVRATQKICGSGALRRFDW